MFQRKKKIELDIQRMLEDFKGVRSISGIKTAKKNVHITEIKNDKGECTTSRKRIDEVFGELKKKTFGGQWERWFRTGIGWCWQLEQHWRAQQQYWRDGRNSRYYDRRVVNRNQQTQKRQISRQVKEFEPKTLKHVMRRWEKWWDNSSTRLWREMDSRLKVGRKWR